MAATSDTFVDPEIKVIPMLCSDRMLTRGWWDSLTTEQKTKGGGLPPRRANNAPRSRGELQTSKA